MDAKAFINDRQVIDHIAAIKRSTKGKRFSDIADQAGNQYVDLVMEGGGVLGIALIGFIYGLEQAGLRFRHVAGTSAGAINALFLQSVGPSSEEKSEKLITLVADMPLEKFQDGWAITRHLMKLALSNSRVFQILSACGFFLYRLLTWRHGLHPGRAFHRWATEMLMIEGIRKWQDITRLADEPIDFVVTATEDDLPREEFEWKPELKMIAIELNLSSRVVFPDDVGLFHDNTPSQNPADFLRASMSVPLFFTPHKIKIKRSATVIEAWRKRGVNAENIPDTAYFWDGGLVANFPISIFHRTSGRPLMPTFGVKLGVDEALSDVTGLRGLAVSGLKAMRADSEQEFIRKHPDYKNIVTTIPTHGTHWLNFTMQNEEKVKLFRSGVEAAKQFLNEFSWEQYKCLRESLSQSTK